MTGATPRGSAVLRRTILAAAGAAAVGLTACSHTATTTSLNAGCRQQYSTWSQGHGKGVLAALGAISAAGAGGDTAVLSATLENNKSAISWAASHPVPDCADPGRYWNALMMHVTAAANTKAASSAQAAMKGVPEIARHLSAELKAL